MNFDTDEKRQNYQLLLSPRFADFSRVTESLYLTGLGGIKRENFEKNHITCIFNVSKEIPNYRLTGIESFALEIDDSSDENIIQYFDLIADKINEVACKGGRTLVHCVAGVSRSAAMVIAYMMKYGKLNLHDAFNHVHSVRQIVRPNNGFFHQLIEYEKKLTGVTTVKMVVIEKGGYMIEIPDFFEHEHKRFVILEILKSKAKHQKNNFHPL